MNTRASHTARTPAAQAGDPQASRPAGRAAADPGAYDLVIIGSGPGGYVCALRAGQLGLRTALVEQDASLGGTCLNVGCIPTKALLHAADLLTEARRARDFGLALGGEPQVDMAALQSYRGRVVTKNTKGVDFLMRKNRVEVVRGHGKLAGPGKVAVTAGGATRTLAARHVVLALGSAARTLPGFDFDGRRVISSTEALTLDRVPPRLAILGAGAVGVEFASIYGRFGSQVTLIELLPRVLPLEDEEVSAELERAFRRQGIAVMTGTRAEKLDRGAGDGEPLAVHVRGSDGKEQAVGCDLLLVAVGRGPASQGAGLEEAGVALEKGYVRVDERLQTSVPGVHAIGDLVTVPGRAHPQLAHLASHEGIFVAEHLAGLDPRPIDYDLVPSCTYCAPEVASVGLSEAEAKRRGVEVKVGRFPFSANSKASILLESLGFVKIVADAKYDQVLGVHIIGPRATELIAEGVTALRLESTSEEIHRAIHAHPTLSEAVMEAAHGVAGHPIHI
jgi:dihydrolipoamide dehydrogenase